MKLGYTAVLLLAVTTSVQAQYANRRPNMPGPAGAQVARTAAELPVGSMKAAGDTVFSEDFANGLAGNNGVGAWTTTEADGNLWVYSHTGPIGAYSNNTEVIESTTAANGFMVYQADSGNSTFGGGAPTPNATFTDWYGALVSPLLDLTATPYVRVDFEQKQRWCCGSAPERVEVSNDGGATWPVSIPVVTAAVNQDPGTIVGSANISGGVIGNPSTVRFRFVFDGAGAGTSHYHWQIDDVKLIEVFDYDLVMQSAANYDFDVDLSFSYDSLQYTVYPYSQLRPVPLNMTVQNNGSVNQSNVTANFTVTQGGNPVLDQDQIINNFGGGVTQKIFVNPDFTPPAVAGTYDVDYSITSAVTDLTPGDNSTTSSFKVDPFSYGRDLGVAAGFELGDSGAYELGNLFHVTNSADLFAVSVAVRSGTGMAGTVVRGSVRLVDADFTLLDNTEEYEIQSSDLNSATGNKFVNLIFANPVTLDAETPYMVCVEHFGGSTPFRTGSNGTSAPQTSFIFYNGQNGLDWYYTTSTPMVRMNFNPSVGISEEAAREIGLRAAPSVFTDATTVRFQHEGGNATWSLMDVSGRVLRTANMGNLGTGNQSIAIDGNGLAAGPYVVRVVSNGTAASVKLLKAGN
ncbi:MAG: T9SS type A sorting domain-containing protein [Flavobacteriales bacterium]